MDRLSTYALVAAIGEMTKPTLSDRQRENDKWVGLRTLSRDATVPIADPPARSEERTVQSAPVVQSGSGKTTPNRRPSLYLGVQQRMDNAMRGMQNR